MKMTLKILFAAIMLTSTAAWAQRQPPPSVDERVQRMTEHLALSPEQQQAVRNLLEQNQADRESRRAAVEAGMQSILTPDQMSKLKAARAARGQHPRGENGAPPPPSKLGGKQKNS